MKRPRVELGTKTKRIFAVVGVLLITGGVAAAGYHAYDWQRVSHSNVRFYDQAVESTNSLLSSDKPTRGALADVVTQLDGVIAQMCAREAFLGSVRTALFEDASAERSRCIEQVKQLVKVRDSTSALVEYLEQDEEIAEAFEKAAKALSKIETGDYDGQKAIYENFLSALEKVTMAGSDDSSLEKQRSIVKQMVSHYDKVIDADAKQQRAEYDKALSSLVATHKELSATADSAAADYATLLRAFEDSLKAT